ncbi:hypothetical protein CDCA_CDCA01G0028 [Cyanidium caldarium]|uniref:Uncharacterized protein n=1 Tax=Cyanidium caldarium TaxID=2771 RepID=A0AAV9IPV3_CYACA|nr:hypothetical protein CDCA_CDCA01G0028 [Cyanidium caldarium]
MTLESVRAPLKNAVCTAQPSHGYLRVRIDFQPPVAVDAYVIKSVVNAALRKLYGSTGEHTISVEVLHCGESERAGQVPTRSSHQATLRTRYADLYRLWAALTLLAVFDAKPCRVVVQHAAAFLPLLGASFEEAVASAAVAL